MASCQTTVENKIEPVTIPIPVPPEKPGVEFQDIADMQEPPKDGLYLSYEDGRRLARYLNNIDAHRQELLTILDHYRDTKN